MKTTLYRYYDTADRLLYVGITKNQFDRQSAHSKGSAWFDAVSRATFEHYETRELALAAETRAIASELPKYNKAGPTLDTEPLSHLVELVSGGLTDRWHLSLESKISKVMHEVNTFSKANELTKLGYSFAASFDWTNDGSVRVVDCINCKSLIDTKWFNYIEEESQSIIDEYEETAR